MGKTNLKQTSEFKLAVETCLTNGHAQVVIALAIHDTSANGHYPGEQKGKGLNYEKIQKYISSFKRSLDNKNQ